MRPASSTAWPAICADCDTWRLISVIEDDSSSAADATVCTLVDACSAAAATAVDWRDVDSAVLVMEAAVDCISFVADVTVCSTRDTSVSNSRVNRSISLVRASRAVCASASRAAAALALIILSLKTSTALAMAPTSSRRSVAGISTLESPPASFPITSVIVMIGFAIMRETTRVTMMASTTETARSPINRVVVSVAVTSAARAVSALWVFWMDARASIAFSSAPN